MSDPETSPAPAAAPTDPGGAAPQSQLLVLLGFGVIVGVGVAFAAYFFLKGVSEAQTYVFATLPKELGFSSAPVWWPLPWPALAGLLVALTIRYLPGSAGHKPAEGFKTGKPRAAGGTARHRVRLSRDAVLRGRARARGAADRDRQRPRRPRRAPRQERRAGAGDRRDRSGGQLRRDQHAPWLALVGAFLLMEAAGLGGPMLGVVLVPGLLAAGVGSLIFIGLDCLDRLGTSRWRSRTFPPFGRPDGPEFLWAVGIGVAAAVLGSAIRRIGLGLQPVVERRAVALTPVVGLAVGGLAVLFAEVTDRGSAEVLFSGQDQLPPSSRRPGAGRSGRWCCSSPARESPTGFP